MVLRPYLNPIMSSPLYTKIIFLITMGSLANLSTPQLILWDREVNNEVNPLMVLNELKLMTIESKHKDDQLIYQNNCNSFLFLIYIK